MTANRLVSLVNRVAEIRDEQDVVQRLKHVLCNYDSLFL